MKIELDILREHLGEQFELHLLKRRAAMTIHDVNQLGCYVCNEFGHAEFILWDQVDYLALLQPDTATGILKPFGLPVPRLTRYAS